MLKKQIINIRRLCLKMLKYFLKFSTDSVLQKLSFCQRQGYPVLLSLIRRNSSPTKLCQTLSTSNHHQLLESLIWKIHKRTMGSVLSRGRKYSPKQIDATKNPNYPVEHAKFACGDASKKSSDYVEGVVCKENELQDNQMKVFDLGEDGKVLLVKQKGKISALGTKCTHYGAPLVSGHLGDGRVRCQWHGACFNIETGDIEDFPGLDSLPCYQVNIVNGDVKVRADKQLLKQNKRVKNFSCPDVCDKRTFIVVGGGAAGANCVETLRQNGFTGRIVLIAAENYLPYDRIKISKALDVDVSKITLRSEEFYKERNIEVLLSTELVSLDPESKSIEISTGVELYYDKIFLATGATPRRLFVNGSDLSNIFVLRTVDDAGKIKEQLSPDKNVVILGTSFIGMEAAAYCVDKVKSVTVIGRDDIPFKKVFGPVIGQRLLALFQEKGVQFRLGCNIVNFEGEDGFVKRAVLTDGSKLDAEICVIGIGVIPNTNYLSKAGIELDRNGTVEVNEYLETSLPDVYAGGDIALAPVLGQKANIGHWGLANYHGHVAAFNMLGKKKSLNAVPFFWTMLFGKSIRYAGYTQNFDDIVIDGNVEELKFIAFFCVGDNVAAVSTLNRDPLAAKFAELLYEGKQLCKSKIAAWLL